MRIWFLVLILCYSITGCVPEETSDKVVQKYSHDLGDISFDSRLDNPNFQICDSTNISTSRRGLSYLGSGGSVDKACKEKFVFNTAFESFDGFVTIRFIVNCNIESDRFRSESMSYDFSAKKCPKELEDHLLTIVRELDQWSPSSVKHESLDHSKYLNFKIKEGRIENVLQ